MLKNCKWCNRVHSHPLRELCPACHAQEEEEFILVYDYVRDFPGHSVSEVSEATGVKVSRILQFLQQGRLNSENLEIHITCEICGVATSSGRICDECRGRLQQKTKEGPARRMHIAEMERYQSRRGK